MARLKAALIQQQMLAALLQRGGGGGPALPLLPQLAGGSLFPIAAATKPAPVTVLLPSGAPIDDVSLRDRDAALKAFKACWRHAGALADNRALLDGKVASAKALAQAVNQARDLTAGVKAEIERRRLSRAVSHMTQSSSSTAAAPAVEGG